MDDGTEQTAAPDGSPTTEEVPHAPQPAIPMPATIIYQQGASNGLAVASLVLGILAVVFFWLFWLAWILGILAIVFGAVGRGKANQGAPNKGMATAGLVLGIVGFAASVLFLVLFVMVANNASDKFQQVADAVANS
jgi:hypothetical protein